MAHATVPNFFLVGAPKAGTTAFLRYLEQHPSVFMSPIKEPCYFAPEVADFGPASRESFQRDREPLRAYLDQPVLERRNSGIVLEWDQYLKLFKGVRQETAIGEGSVSYLGSPVAAASIRNRLPDARIVMLLRDPADRVRSHWAASIAAGATTFNFVTWLEERLELERLRVPRLGPVWSGFYAIHLKRFLAHFPASQIKPLFYDDYIRDSQSVLRDAFGFLGVDTSWVSNVSRRHNVTLVPKWPKLHRLMWPARLAARAALPKPAVNRIREWWREPFRPAVNPDERARAIEVYRDDIRELEALLQRDLSAWLEPNRA